MERTTDFKPIERLGLPRVGDVDCSGLILVVGPNSSGKTQLLRDIRERVVGNPRQLVVARELRIQKPANFDEFIRVLKADGLFVTPERNTETTQLFSSVTRVGTGEPVNSITLEQARAWHDVSRPNSFSTQADPFFGHFGPMLAPALFLERRLAGVTEAPAFNHEANPPQSDLQALHLLANARRDLEAETRRSFGKAVWLDAQRGALCLRVAPAATAPTAEQRLDPKYVSRFRQIETEGDGLKSYVAISIAVLLGRWPVMLLDEPEMCLHPPQAYSLGRFIGSHVGAETATFVATHSSHILRGAIQSGAKMQIIRLTSDGAGQFDAHAVSSDRLAEALKKPSVRAEAVLDGIFARGVVLVEADGDRSVYEAAWEALPDGASLDIHFSACGGSAGIRDVARLYRDLNIPVAAIVDLDTMMDAARFRQIVEPMADAATTDHLLRAASEARQAIEGTEPALTEELVRTRLRTIAEMPTSWSSRDDVPLVGALRGLANDVDRTKSVKAGVDSFSDELRVKLLDLISAAAAVGVFLVPVGELEGWLSDSDIAASKSKKAEWANEASALIRDSGYQARDVWAFVAEVEKYLFPAAPAAGGEPK